MKNNVIENKETINNNVIDINLSTIKSVSDCINRLAITMDKHDNITFKIALYAGLMCGLEIPAYTTKDGVEVPACKLVKPTTLKEAMKSPKLANRSKSVVSRCKNALQLVIDAGDFGLFASGTYPFTYDKILLYYNNIPAFENAGYTCLKDAFSNSLRFLEGIVSDYNESIAPASDSDSAPADSDSAPADSDSAPADELPSSVDDNEMCNFIFNGKTYSCRLVAMLSLLENSIEIIK